MVLHLPQTLPDRVQPILRPIGPCSHLSRLRNLRPSMGNLELSYLLTTMWLGLEWHRLPSHLLVYLSIAMGIYLNLVTLVNRSTGNRLIWSSRVLCSQTWSLTLSTNSTQHSHQHSFGLKQRISMLDSPLLTTP